MKALFGGMQIGDRIRRAGTDHRALMLSGQEGVGPVFGTVRAESAMIGQDNKGRQVIALAAQRITDPRPGTGKTRELKTGRLQQRPLAMHTGLADDVMHKGDVIDDRAERSDDIAEHLAALSIGLESPGAAETGARGALKQLHGLPGSHG